MYNHNQEPNIGDLVEVKLESMLFGDYFRMVDKEVKVDKEGKKRISIQIFYWPNIKEYRIL